MNAHQNSTKRPITPLLGMIFGATFGLVAVTQTQAGYLTNPDEDIVVNDYQECWQISGGKPAPRPECGDILDSDGDGVPDDKDKCPDTPAGVLVDKDGCPQDSDGDGVPDYRDKCPGTPPGAAVDEDGCPSDDDGDGVPNHRDKCPDTRPGAKVDEDGCEIVDSVVLNIVSDGFDFDRSKIKPHMVPELDTLAARIKQSPGKEQIDITGHTDSIGTQSYNMGLSKRRASSVADYLSRKGLDRGDMRLHGKGESEPVATNRTRAGRKQNRRVEVRTQ